MNPNSRVAAKMWNAVLTGRARPFAEAASNLGAGNAALVLVDKFVEGPAVAKAAIIRSRHLLREKNIRCDPGSADLIAQVLRQMTDYSTMASDLTKLDLIEALLPLIEARHLQGIVPTKFGADGARLIGTNVPLLPDPLAWAETAVAFRDPVMLAAVKPQLAPGDPFLLWQKMPIGNAVTWAECLLVSGIHPETAAEKAYIYGLAVDVEDKQDEVVALLANCWPDVIPTMEIPQDPTVPDSYWHGKSLKILLEGRASLVREKWIAVLRSDAPAVFVEQVKALGESSQQLLNWNDHNSAGLGYHQQYYQRPSFPRPMAPADSASMPSPSSMLPRFPSPQWSGIWLSAMALLC
jgi:hypothetical protein